MPSWKRVIVSGSDAALNSLNITTSLTASGNIYPTGLGIDRQVLKTDGAGNLTFAYAEEIVAIVKNVSGVTLQKGTPVHATASGAMGNVVGIIAALASDATTMPATFVLNETLLDGAEGEALASGFIQGVNTGMFAVGQIIYVGEMGGYTGTKPTGSNLIQNLGIVTKVSTINGSGFVLGAGRSNDLPNIQPGYAWVGNSHSVPTAISTSSIQNVVSASFATTASYATQALSASYAPGGAGTPAFPFTGSAIISGSLEITGSLAVQDANGNTNIDSLNRQLYGAPPPLSPGAPSVLSIDWGIRQLFDSNGNISVAWKDRSLSTPNGYTAVNWSDDTFLTSYVYQRDYKSAATQDAVSTNYANVSLSYLGDVIESNGTTTIIDSTVTEGMLVYLDTSTVWYPVNQAATGATKLLGIAHNLVSLPLNPPFPSNQTGQILLEGHVVIDDTSTSGPKVAGAAYGLPVYIRDNTTTGQMDTALPTTTGSNVVRLLGHCYQQNSGTSTQWMMKFRPSNDWVEI